MPNPNSGTTIDLLIDLLDKGHTKRFHQLIHEDRSLLRKRDARGNTLLTHAIWRGDEELAKQLIELGASVNESDGVSSCLHDAIDAKTGGNLKMARLLLEASANTEVRGFNDWTPLHRAASCGYVQFVQMLLDFGADANARTSIDELETPLMVAAWSGQAQTVQMLLAHGADPKLTGLSGRTAEEMADSQGHPGVAEILRTNMGKQ